MIRAISFMLVALMIGVIAWAVSTGHERKETEESLLYSGYQAVKRIESEIRIRAATSSTSINGRGWPETIDPAWFGEDPPLNPYVTADHPWVEVAADHESSLQDPAIRQVVSREVAGFWYNPANGVVRIRIGPHIVDQRAIELYNRLNGSSVSSLFGGGVTVTRAIEEAGDVARDRD